MTHLEETALQIQDEVHWRLLRALWEIANLKPLEGRSGPSIALAALRERDAETGGEVWRRFTGAAMQGDRMCAPRYRYRVVTRSGGGGQRAIAVPPRWIQARRALGLRQDPVGEFVFDSELEAVSLARDLNRANGSRVTDPRNVKATYQVRREEAR